MANLFSGADPELSNHEHLTPFLLACREGHVDVVRHLVQASVNMAATDSCERNCLMLAVAAKREDVIQVTTRLFWCRSCLTAFS